MYTMLSGVNDCNSSVQFNISNTKGNQLNIRLTHINYNFVWDVVKPHSGKSKSKCTDSEIVNQIQWELIIIIIIAPLTIVSEDQWEDLECLYKACQATRTDGDLFTDTG